MNTAIVEQGRLRNRSFGRAGANLTTLKRFVVDFLHGLETVTLGALVFVKRHGVVAIISKRRAQQE
jgi:hypothetical protein